MDGHCLATGNGSKAGAARTCGTYEIDKREIMLVLRYVSLNNFFYIFSIQFGSNTYVQIG